MPRALLRPSWSDPLMVTEGLPIACSTCFDREAAFLDDRPSSASSQTINPASADSVAAITDALRNINFSAHRTPAPTSEEDAQAHRASLLRTGSSNSTPPAAALSSGSAMETPPASPSQAPPIITSHSAGNAASGGPIFFGDPLAGYTTAYIFRIPDIHARGHKRIYAFLALSTHKERVAMKTFGFIAAAFRDMATWIQQLADAEAEATSGARRMNTAPSSVQSSSLQQSTNVQDGGSAFDRAAGSAFLGGGSAFARRAGGGGGAIALKARGLPELVGMPDFLFSSMSSLFKSSESWARR
ncbi:unnamed protein product [Parascedosporium putredinis]|uniref:UDENN FLCN/SMCR8-type domain-containing protein n=1 Tax=Parascedosporium putredinis TaxID=1442378 RepID=A0A9P1HAP3_9PEZI|nr:unnamed protein product [Parascedosporium putredinis]CAI8004763.1 unnamed protein product [Parascedosporium putredinis]